MSALSDQLQVRSPDPQGLLGLSGCNLSERSCAALSSVLSSQSSSTVTPFNTCCLSSDSCGLSLDSDTANRNLRLSDNNRTVTRVREEQPYPDHPERFDLCPQLMCREALTGRCYWEVEWRGGVSISVTYRGTSRRGESEDCWFGWNDQSWNLNCSGDSYYVRHNKRETRTSSSSSSFFSSSSGRVAVYLDHPAGSLSFYRVSSDTLIYLHTFRTTFTEPLNAGFWIGSGSSVSLCPLQE
ncbi:stonustoxin subunit beta-like [Eleginops maclovinus]|uniref:stonustoxin subunit beta-like n=1 Tax=Eleginops maclovinus TaxID=56733 RepID=UPI0030805B15